MYFAGGLTPSDLAENQHNQGLDRAKSLLQLVVFPLLAVLFTIHWQKLSTKIRSFAIPLSFCGLAILSTAWSPSPGFTLRRSVITLGFTLFSLYLGARFSLPEQINLYGWMTVTFVVASYLLVIVKPEWALSTGNHWGSWRGVFGHKNTLGRMALFGAVVLVGGRPSEIPRAINAAVATGSVVLIFLSGSATSLMAAIMICAVSPFLLILKVRTRKTLPLWSALLPLAVFLAATLLANFGLILEGIGRDPTLTGRTALWSALIDVASKKPFLGFGYASFWHYDGPDRQALYRRVGWSPPHAHNAYLDMWLDFGYPGLVGLLGLIAVTLIKSARLFQISPSRAAKFPLLLVFFAICANCTESDLFRSHAFMWCPLVGLYTSLKLLEMEPAKKRSPQPRALLQAPQARIDRYPAGPEFAQ